MRKSALALAVTLAASLTLANADAAKKRQGPPAKPKDAAYEWNIKHMPPMAAPSAAKPAKAAKGSKKKGLKKAAKGSKKKGVKGSKKKAK